MTGILKRLDQPELVLGKDAREDREIVWADGIGNPARRANGAGKSDRLCDEGGGRGRVSGDHDGMDSERAQLLDHGL